MYNVWVSPFVFLEHEYNIFFTTYVFAPELQYVYFLSACVAEVVVVTLSSWGSEANVQQQKQQKQ